MEETFIKEVHAENELGGKNEKILEQGVWAFSHFIEMSERPYSASDFEKEFFIPDL